MMKTVFVFAAILVASVAASPVVDVPANQALWQSSSADAAVFDIRRELIDTEAGDYGCAVLDEVKCKEDDLCEYLEDAKVCVDFDLTCEDLSKAEYDRHFKKVCKELTYPNGDAMCKFNKKKKACITLQTPEPTSCAEIVSKQKCNKASSKFETMKTDCYWNKAEGECLDLPSKCSELLTRADCNNAMREFPDTMTTDCYYNPVEEVCENLPTKCEDLVTKQDCKKALTKFPDTMKTACYFDEVEGVCTDLATECKDLVTKAECNKASLDFGIIGCLFVEGECTQVKDCTQIVNENKCKEANKAIYPGLKSDMCLYQKKACQAPPATCEEINGKQGCKNADKKYGLEHCDYISDECLTMTCGMIEKAGKCRKAFEEYGLRCQYVGDECVEL